MRLILASKSPARLALLRRAGLAPEVIVSGFEESQIRNPVPIDLAMTLARCKGESVVRRLDGDYILIACDSVLEFEGRAHGKPGTEQAAIERWQRMRAREGILHTGHYVAVSRASALLTTTAGAWLACLCRSCDAIRCACRVNNLSHMLPPY